MRIVFDPGHGGRDRLKRGPTGYVEADGVLDIALRARDVLLAAGVQVSMTRESDIDLCPDVKHYDSKRDLTARTDLASRLQPDLFLSIHTNGWGPAGQAQTKARGTETFAQLMNAASQAAGRLIQDAVVAALGTQDRGCKVWTWAGQQHRVDSPTRPTQGRDYLHILREAQVPAVLIEVAFHDHPEEEQYLKRAAFRAKAARAIAVAILRWGKQSGHQPVPVELPSGRVLPGELKDGTTHALVAGVWVPVRAFGEAFGAVVDWIAEDAGGPRAVIRNGKAAPG